jgi:hypothetical protein
MTEQYHAYLVRLWLKKRENEWTWKVYLKNIHTGEQHGFSSMESFISFLKEHEETECKPIQMEQTNPGIKEDKLKGSH